MYTLLLTLHVLSAVLLIGPFVFAGFTGHRAIRGHDAVATRGAAQLMTRFALGSLAVAALGMGALGLSHRYSFRTPWVIISLTLYVIAMGIATGYTVPALRGAANMIEQGILGQPPNVPAAADAAAPPATTAAPDAPAAPDTEGTPDTEAPPETDKTPAIEKTPETAPPTFAATGTELAAKERLDNIAGRVAGSGALVTAAIIIITILMVTRPFGR